jgi:hypothetical protein
MQSMNVYGCASNQHVNVDKSKLLPVGVPALAPLPDTIAGIPVIHSATTLGITFHARIGPANPKREWHELQSKITTKFTKLGRLPLSAFGRALGDNTYALSKVLFYLEHTGLPTAAQLESLDKALAKLVDRANGTNGFTYVRKELLMCPAKHGGFGVLSLKHHIRARHAVWAVQLLTGVGTIPWIHLGRSLLRLVWGSGWHTMLPLFIGAQCADYACHISGRIAPMPAPLARIFHALHSLPAVDDVSEVQLQLWALVCLCSVDWEPVVARRMAWCWGAIVAVTWWSCCGVTLSGALHISYTSYTLQQITNGNKAHGVLYQGSWPRSMCLDGYSSALVHG